MTFNYSLSFYAESVKSERKSCLHALQLFLRSLDAPERLAGREFYLSAFTFGSELSEHMTVHQGSVRSYSGSCFADFLWFDIDDEQDLDRAYRASQALWNVLIGEGVSASALLRFFSGRKGFHVGVPMTLFSSTLSPSSHFNQDAKATALYYADRAGVRIDPAIYDKTRLLRAPNSLHPSSGRYKIPILEGEDFLELSKQQRRFAYSYPQAVQPVLQWQEAAVFQQRSSSHTTEHTNTCTDTHCEMQKILSSGEIVPRLRRSTFQLLTEGAPVGERNHALFRAACDALRCGFSSDALYALFLDFGKKVLDLGPYEVEKTLASALAAERGQR